MRWRSSKVIFRTAEGTKADNDSIALVCLLSGRPRRSGSQFGDGTGRNGSRSLCFLICCRFSLAPNTCKRIFRRSSIQVISLLTRAYSECAAGFAYGGTLSMPNKSAFSTSSCLSEWTIISLPRLYRYMVLVLEIAVMTVRITVEWQLVAIV